MAQVSSMLWGAPAFNASPQQHPLQLSFWQQFDTPPSNVYYRSTIGKVVLLPMQMRHDARTI